MPVVGTSLFIEVEVSDEESIEEEALPAMERIKKIETGKDNRYRDKLKILGLSHNQINLTRKAKGGRKDSFK